MTSRQPRRREPGSVAQSLIDARRTLEPSQMRIEEANARTRRAEEGIRCVCVLLRYGAGIDPFAPLPHHHDSCRLTIDRAAGRHTTLP